MATLTIEIRRTKGRREYPVSFLICSGKTKKRLPTGITVTDSELSSNGKRIRHPHKARLFEEKRRELQDRLDELMMETLGREADAAYIAERLVAVSAEKLDFFVFAGEWLEHSKIKGKKNYVCMLNTLERFLGRRSLPFDMVTFRMLSGFEEFLAERPRAQSLYLGQMRHLYREAMRRYNTDYDQAIKNDPFMRYRVPRQRLVKGVRALTMEQLSAVSRYQGEGRAQLARDCFMLSFGLMGMNSADMYDAVTMRGDAICYNRAKTRGRRSDGAYIEVRVHPALASLVRRYGGKERVFGFSERYASAQEFNRALNIGLKEVGRQAGIEGLSFYQARHTFATLSRNLMRFSKSDVDEALNHVGSYDIADVYIVRDFSIINDNNFRLIDEVLPKVAF